MRRAATPSTSDGDGDAPVTRRLAALAMSPVFVQTTPSMNIPGTGSMNIPGTGSMTTASWVLNAQRRDRKTWTTIRARINADVHAQQLTSVELEDMLHQLLSIALPHPRIRSEEIAGMITALAQVLPLRSDLLCSEFMRFVHKSCMKDRVLFTPAQLAVVVAFVLAFVKVCASWYTAGAIRALGLVLHDNADRAAPSDLDALVAVLLKHLDSSGVDIDARYAATSCVANICTHAARTPAVFQYFSALLRVVAENVRQQALSLTKESGGSDSSSDTNDRLLVKACTCSIKCIFTIIQTSHDRLSDRIDAALPGLLSSMRQVVGYGLVLQHDRDAFVIASRPELSPTDSDSSTCGSDSSLSDARPISEGLLARLRITVLHTLEAIAHHFPKALTSSVGLYLPEQTTPFMMLFNNAPSVLTLLLADPCERVRVAAAKFLDAFWEKMPLKQYFRHAASVVAPSTSFASMPKRLSLMLYQVHVTLVYCIQNEQDGLPLAQTLKTAASVIQHCPYASVAALLDQSDVTPSLGDILKALAPSLYAATSSSDHSVRMASLACFSALLNLPDPIPAVLEWMVRPNDARTCLTVAHVTILCGTLSLSKRSFVAELLAIASRPDDAARTLLRLEAMSLLSKIAKNYAPALSANWHGLADFLLVAFQDADPNVRLQAVKILENYIKGESTSRIESAGAATATSPPLTRRNSLDAADTNASSRAMRSTSSRWLRAPLHISAVPRTESLDFLAMHVMRAFRDSSHHVRASVCACFTLLRPSDWTYLCNTQSRRLPATLSLNTSRSLEMYTSLFLQTPRDSSPVVRAAGFRLLGSLCLAPVFKTRAFASAVVALALESLGDATLNVRVRGAWALGNVCTTPGPEVASSNVDPPESPAAASDVASSLTNDVLLFELLPVAQMQQVVERMLVYINDNDKVASSVARTLGLVCRWLRFEPFVGTTTAREQRVLDDLLAQTMIALAAKINAGSPKVRWNACHAIAKVLLCPSLPLATAPWAPIVFHALVTAIAQQENFKVRISAASALRVSRTRSGYGTSYCMALRATFDALETASDLKDVTEFKYKEQLETQLSFTLVHLLQIATVEDDAVIRDVLQAKPPAFLYDWLFHNLHRMCSVIERETARTTAAAAAGLTSTGYSMDDMHSSSDDVGSTSGGDVHDVDPVRKEDILAAVGALLRILQRDDAHSIGSSRCVSILYDAKLSLERDVLFSSDDDIGFEM